MHSAQALSTLRSAFGGLSIRDCSRSALELEVVEVKNACPYRQITTLNKKGRAKVSYQLTDGGPHNRVRSTPELRPHLFSQGMRYILGGATQIFWADS